MEPQCEIHSEMLIFTSIALDPQMKVPPLTKRMQWQRPLTFAFYQEPMATLQGTFLLLYARRRGPSISSWLQSLIIGSPRNRLGESRNKERGNSDALGMADLLATPRLTVMKGPEPDTKWRTMNFTKFNVSVGNSYYKSFNDWFSCNPRTVGQFLHSVALSVSGALSSGAQLSVTSEHHTRAGELVALQRDYFCCFMAVQKDGELCYGDDNSGSSNLRWQRTSLKLENPGEIHCLFGFRAASGSVRLTFKLTSGSHSVVEVALVGGSTADAKVSRKRKNDVPNSPPSPVQPRGSRSRTSKRRDRDITEIDDVAHSPPPRSARRHSSNSRADSSSESVPLTLSASRNSAASMSPAGTPLFNSVSISPVPQSIVTAASAPLSLPLAIPSLPPPPPVASCCSAGAQEADVAEQDSAVLKECCKPVLRAPSAPLVALPIPPTLLVPTASLPAVRLTMVGAMMSPLAVQQAPTPVIAQAPASSSCCTPAGGSKAAEPSCKCVGCCGDGPGPCACCPLPQDADLASSAPLPADAPKRCCVVPCHRPPVIVETLHSMATDSALELGIPGVLTMKFQ